MSLNAFASATMLMFISATSAHHVVDTAKISPDAQDALIAGAKIIIDKVRNPDAIKIRNVRLGKDPKDGDYFICGELNGQNGLGGMVGFQPFLIEQGSLFAREGPDDPLGDVTDKVIPLRCDGNFPLSKDVTSNFRAAINSQKGQ